MGLHQIQEAVDSIKKHSKLQPHLAVTLGSGLASFVDDLDIDVAISYEDIPHFSPPSVTGHPGQLVIGKIGGTPLAVLQGRIHYYEGHDWSQVVFPTRVLAHWGTKNLILTNAAGGLDPQMQPGDFMIITDHINLTGGNPLRGPNEEALGPRFPDMTEAYCPILNLKLDQIMKSLQLRYSKGVYCGVLGPSYETAAEIQYLRSIGGSAVGMSTVAETIAARHMGVTVTGISCITNLATGLSSHKLSHDEVKETAHRVESDFRSLLREFISQI